MPSGLVRSLPEIVRRAVQARIADCHVALPGKVVRYDATTNLADVEVMVKHPLFDGDGRALDGEDLGVLVGVPVKWPRAGGFYMSFPLAADDEGELVFHSTPIGEWRTSGQKGDPDDASRHSLGWPTFRADLFNDSRALPDVSARGAGIVIGKEGSDEQIRIQSGLVQVGASAAVALVKNQAIVDLQSAINGWTPVSNDGGAALKTALTTWLTATYGTSLFKAK